jgi:hypothetical protein
MAEELAKAALEVEDWFNQRATLDESASLAEWLDRARELVAVDRRIDKRLDSVLARRTQIAAMAGGPKQRDAARAYLHAASAVIDLSGRIRYRFHDALYELAFQVASRPPERDRLIEVLLQGRSSIGATVMAEVLFDPPPDNPNRAVPASRRTKERLLELIALSGQVHLLPLLAEYVGDDATEAPLRVLAAETIRRLGLPQQPRPGQDPSLPAPAITAAKLRAILSGIEETQLPGNLVARCRALLAWLDESVSRGVQGNQYRLGRFDAQAGDWLLMRNPSPYNLFTDLAPGLFTHVGVITIEESTDGLRRMVVVDLPEVGRKMEATNLDTFIQRTLHYVVLRHADPAVAAIMAERARNAIECPTEFDLNFRTERVTALRGRLLEGRKIHTYCAGLLLLCAQESGRDRAEFFPIVEYPAGGNTETNLAKLGLSFGRDFISPTGALFSPALSIVGRCEAMYDPRREIEQAVYDYFARRLVEARLAPSPDLLQRLRLKLAEAAAASPTLARALADAAGVHQGTDLVSAAKAAAVVETLDQIATVCSGEFLRAREALLVDPMDLPAGGNPGGQTDREMEALRKEHRSLFTRWQAGRLTPRQLRIELVAHYAQKGKRQIDSRFFQASSGL